MEAEDLIGKDMRNFVVREMTEVCEIDEDGLYRRSIGFFRNETIAKAFAQDQRYANRRKTRKAIILTDERVGFTLGGPVELLIDEKEILEIRRIALAKLSDEERAILKL